MNNIEFGAPWSRSLKISTVSVTGLLVVIGVAGVLTDANQGWLLLVLPPALLAAFIGAGIRGYALNEDAILVRRWGWITRLPLAELRDVAGKADAFNHAFRFFLSAGAFGFVGICWSVELKLFHAYATDPSRAVVLRHGNKRIVITPHDPQQFIMRARTLLKTAAYPG